MLGVVYNTGDNVPRAGDSLNNANGVSVRVSHVIITPIPTSGVDVYGIRSRESLATDILISGATLIFDKKSEGWIRARESVGARYVPPSEYPPSAQLVQLVLDRDPKEVYLPTDIREEKRLAYKTASGVTVMGAMFNNQHLTLAKSVEGPSRAELLFWGDLCLDHHYSPVIDGRLLLYAAERHADEAQHDEDERRIAELESTVTTLVSRIQLLECKFATLAKTLVVPARDPQSRPPSPDNIISPRAFDSVIFRKLSPITISQINPAYEMPPYFSPGTIAMDAGKACGDKYVELTK